MGLVNETDEKESELLPMETNPQEKVVPPASGSSASASQHNAGQSRRLPALAMAVSGSSQSGSFPQFYRRSGGRTPPGFRGE